MPMLALIRALTMSRTKGSSMLAVRRSATFLASSTSAPIKRTANSSPPRRTTTSELLTTEVSLGPNCRSNWSPTGCPNESFISLK